MKLRIMTVLLALLLLASVFVSCDSSEGSASAESSSVTAADPEIQKIDDYVADLVSQNNFNGATFTYVGEGGHTAEFEEETGNIENDALYFRQRELEELFGIKWQSKVIAGYDDTQTTNIATFVREAVMAGQKDYDLVYGNPISVGAVLFVNNCLMDVSGFDDINLDAVWWDSSLGEKFGFGGRMYFLTGAIVSSYFKDASCVLFNKDIVEDYGIEEPYELVASGAWTFDKMFEIASVVPLNSSGSGAYRYGNPNGLAILFAHGEAITEFDENGNPYVESSLPVELSDIADKYSVVMSDDDQTVHLKNLNRMGAGAQEDYEVKYGYKDSSTMFADDLILFEFGTTGLASALREKEVEFGIVPMPKGDGSQQRYYSFADNWSSVFVYVPRCTGDVQMTDVITEAMAALGQKHIKPAYYDKILKNRSVYDSASREMIDIIFTSKVYDMADMYAGGDIHSPGRFISAIKYAVDDDSSTFANNYFVYSKMANKEIEKLLARVASFE